MSVRCLVLIYSDVVSLDFRELEEELEKQKKLSQEKRATQNKDIVELEQKIDNLR